MILKSENEIIPYKHITRVTKDNFTLSYRETIYYYRIYVYTDFSENPIKVFVSKDNEVLRNKRFEEIKNELDLYYKGLNNGK